MILLGANSYILLCRLRGSTHALVACGHCSSKVTSCPALFSMFVLRLIVVLALPRGLSCNSMPRHPTETAAIKSERLPSTSTDVKSRVSCRSDSDYRADVETSTLCLHNCSTDLLEPVTISINSTSSKTFQMNVSGLPIEGTVTFHSVNGSTQQKYLGHFETTSSSLFVDLNVSSDAFAIIMTVWRRDGTPGRHMTISYERDTENCSSSPTAASPVGLQTEGTRQTSTPSNSGKSDNPGRRMITIRAVFGTFPAAILLLFFCCWFIHRMNAVFLFDIVLSDSL